MAHRIALLVVAIIVSGVQSAFACWGPQGHPRSWVSGDADVIVRARVWRLTDSPAATSAVRTGETLVRLGVVEGTQGRSSIHCQRHRNAQREPRHE